MFPVGDQHDIFSKTVNDHVEQTPVEPHLYLQHITGIHLKQPVGVILEGFAGQLRTGNPAFLSQSDIGHTVNPV